MFKKVKQICDIARMNCGDKLKRMLNPDCVKTMARHILNMFERRRELTYVEA